MITGILPYVKITSLNPDANMVTIVNSDILRLVGSPVKSQRKVVEKEQWPFERRLIPLGCVSQLRKSLFCGKLESWDRNTPSYSPRARGTTQKIWKERVHRKESFKNANLRSEFRGASKFRRKNARRNPETRAIRPQRSAGPGERCL